MNTKLTKELVEQLISNKYSNVRNFNYTNNSIEFEYDYIKDEPYVIDNKQLVAIIKTLEQQNRELGVRLDQLEICYKMLLEKVFE